MRSAAPAVDPGFLRALHRLDPRLRTHWCPKSEHWRIDLVKRRPVYCYEFEPGKPLWAMLDVPFPIIHVQDEQKRFLPLDARALVRLYEADTWSGDGLRDYITRLRREERDEEQDFETAWQPIRDEMAKDIAKIIREH